MDPIIISVDDRLEGAGSVLPVAGHIDDDSYSVGDHDFRLPGGIDYDLVLTNAGEGILDSGIVRAHVIGTCDRCLEDAEFDIASEVDEYFLFEAPAEQDLSDDEDEVDFSLVGEDHTIDLAEPIMAAIVMETPFVVLCREDCKGICPICGQNRNIAPCTCQEGGVRQNNPFSALSELLTEDEEV